MSLLKSKQFKRKLLHHVLLGVVVEMDEVMGKFLMGPPADGSPPRKRRGDPDPLSPLSTAAPNSPSVLYGDQFAEAEIDPDFKEELKKPEKPKDYGPFELGQTVMVKQKEAWNKLRITHMQLGRMVKKHPCGCMKCGYCCCCCGCVPETKEVQLLVDGNWPESSCSPTVTDFIIMYGFDDNTRKRFRVRDLYCHDGPDWCEIYPFIEQNDEVVENTPVLAWGEKLNSDYRHCTWTKEKIKKFDDTQSEVIAWDNDSENWVKGTHNGNKNNHVVKILAYSRIKAQSLLADSGSRGRLKESEQIFMYDISKATCLEEASSTQDASWVAWSHRGSCLGSHTKKQAKSPTSTGTPNSLNATGFAEELVSLGSTPSDEREAEPVPDSTVRKSLADYKKDDLVQVLVIVNSTQKEEEESSDLWAAGWVDSVDTSKGKLFPEVKVIIPNHGVFSTDDIDKSALNDTVRCTKVTVKLIECIRLLETSLAENTTRKAYYKLEGVSAF